LERLTAVEIKAPGEWQIATVTDIKVETPRVKSFRFAVPMWMAHLPGQHYDVRLTAPDGYRAQRSYSVASSPLDVGAVELTIDLLDDGEVSPYFHEVVQVGDEVELRGPFTSYFVWRGESPVVLVGGGSGIAPLMAMLRHKRRAVPDADMRIVYSVRHADDVIYEDELDGAAALTYTRDAPDGWTGHTGHIDAELLREPAAGAQLAFVCGSNGFVETGSDLLLELGMHPESIRTERFGATL
jgi:ferredoxin-NADP reductase